MPTPVHVILNPTSSSGKAAALERRVRTALRERGVGHRLRTTEARGHATELAVQARVEGARTVVAVGGDGTVHEVANGLLAGDTTAEGVPALAVVPVGTGNDFFRMVGGPSDVDATLALVEHGVRTLFDVGRARWAGGSRYFVNLLGVGVDVDVIRRRDAFRRLPGLAQYLTALLVALLRFQPVPLQVRLSDDVESGEGDEVIEGRTHLAAITVGPSAGGGFLLNPAAEPADGALDLCWVDALSYLQVLTYLPRVVRGTHETLDVVRLRRFRHGRLERSDGDALEFELDGEVMVERVPWIEVSVEPGRLPVLVPDTSAEGRRR